MFRVQLRVRLRRIDIGSRGGQVRSGLDDMEGCHIDAEVLCLLHLRSEVQHETSLARFLPDMIIMPRRES